MFCCHFVVFIGVFGVPQKGSPEASCPPARRSLRPASTQWERSPVSHRSLVTAAHQRQPKRRARAQSRVGVGDLVRWQLGAEPHPVRFPEVTAEGPPIPVMSPIAPSNM